MTTEVKVPFGRTADGKLISAEAAMRGLACECACPKCRARLVACQGEVLRHHFRHHVETVECSGARETAIHQFAKQVIIESRALRLPDDRDLGSMLFAHSEVRLGKIVPDVLARFQSEEVAIEIWVAHGTSAEKIDEYASRNLAAVEIDLRPYRQLDGTEAMWRKAILEEADRHWLFPCRDERELNERLRQERLAQMRRDQAAVVEAVTQAARLADIEDERLAQMKRDRLATIVIAEQERIARAQHAEAYRLKERAKAEQQRKNEAEERAATEELITAHERRLEKLRTPPDLHALIRAHGSYAAIPPEAWAEHDTAVGAHRNAMREGTYYQELQNFRARWRRAPRKVA